MTEPQPLPDLSALGVPVLPAAGAQTDGAREYVVLSDDGAGPVYVVAPRKDRAQALGAQLADLLGGTPGACLPSAATSGTVFVVTVTVP